MKRCFCFYIAGLLLLACTSNKVEITEHVSFKRFDKELFSLNHEKPDLTQIDSADRKFFRMYASGVLQLGDVEDERFSEYLSCFIKDPIMNEVYDTVNVHYPNLDMQERDLSVACSQLKRLLPEVEIPQFYVHISGFNQSVIVDSSVVSVSLDNYLGEQCPFYRMLSVPVPVYLRERMNDDFIVRDVVYGWMSSEFVFRPKDGNVDLLSGLIYQGKVLCLMEMLLPIYPREKIFGFTPEKMKWCEENEAAMWEFMIEEKYLFSTNQTAFRKLLNEAPFSSGMPNESPGRAITWNGYQIVKLFMDKSGCTLREMLEEQDYHKMLRVAAYRPK